MDAVILSPEQIRESVSMAAAIEAVREGFLGLARGEFEMPTRISLRDGQFLVMSAQHVPTATSIVKTLSLNFGGRQPAIIGTVAWLDLQSTRNLLADAGAVTTLRTAAASGVATDLLAATDASRLTMIGAGVQAANQVRAVCAVRPIRTVTVADQLADRAESFAAGLRAELPEIEFRVQTDSAVAVSDADVVCCATTSTEPLFPLEALPAHVHVNAIGAFRPTMRELPDELLADAGVVYIDEKEAILDESGEVIHAIAAGAITEHALVELGTALTQGSLDRSGRTVFKTVGVAMQDWAIMRMLADRLASA